MQSLTRSFVKTPNRPSRSNPGRPLLARKPTACRQRASGRLGLEVRVRRLGKQPFGMNFCPVSAQDRIADQVGSEPAGRNGRLCRLLDYVDLTLCARYKPCAGAENVKGTVYIIRNPLRVGRCCRGDTHRIIIAALPSPVRSRRKSMTDLAYPGSYPALEIMLSMSLH